MRNCTWGPWGLGQWKGHPGVYCRVCGWPEYSLWIDKTPPPGDCPEGKTSARSCQRVLDRLMINAWARAATGNPEPHAAIEMLRKVTSLSWEEIEKMCDESGRGSHTIADLKAEVAMQDILAAAGYSPCPSCGKTIDRGDVAWNNPTTSEGTPYIVVEIQCQHCDTEIVNFKSWYPGVDDFAELVECVFKDLPKNPHYAKRWE